MTVTGKTLAENLDALPGLKQGQDVIQTIEKPIKSSGHLQILYGNLAPEGCVGKITGKEGLQFKGPARVFDSEEDMLKALDKDPMSLKVMALYIVLLMTVQLGFGIGILGLSRPVDGVAPSIFPSPFQIGFSQRQAQVESQSPL